MPRRLPSGCNRPGCPRLDPGGWCDAHRPAARTWGDRSSTPDRIRGRQLQRLRGRLFDEQPLCVRCLELGRVTIATVRDHVLALALGGADTEDNVQPLCGGCNEEKRKVEACRKTT